MKAYVLILLQTVQEFLQVLKNGAEIQEELLEVQCKIEKLEEIPRRIRKYRQLEFRRW